MIFSFFISTLVIHPLFVAGIWYYLFAIYHYLGIQITLLLVI